MILIGRNKAGRQGMHGRLLQGAWLVVLLLQLSVIPVLALGLEQAGIIAPVGGDAQLLGPRGFCYDRLRETLIVANTEADRVVLLNRQGMVAKVLGNKGELRLPMAVAVTAATLYIAQKDSEKLKVLADYDSGTGEDYRELDLSGYRVKTAVQPVALFADRNGIYVADRANRQILVLDRKDTLKFRIADVGEPAALWADDRNIYVADPGFGGVKVYGGDGAWRRTLGTMPGNFAEPLRIKAITVDHRQRLWLLLEGNRGLLAMDANGNVLTRFPASPAATASFFGATDLAIDQEDNLYVLEQGLNRIVVFRISEF